MKEIKVKLTFTEPVLGTCPGDPDIYTTFIASKSPDANTLEDEVAAIGVDGVVEKGKTIFPKLDDERRFSTTIRSRGSLRIPAAGCERSRAACPAASRRSKKKLTNWFLWNPGTFPSCLTAKWESASVLCGRRRCRESA